MTRRRSDQRADDSALDPARGVVWWTLTTLAIFALGTALAALMLPAHGQTLVSIDRAGYTTGMQHVECWLVPRTAAAIYVTGTLVVDCHDSIDGVFANGFEAPK